MRRTDAPGWTVAAPLVTDVDTAARQVRAAGAVLLVACVVFALSAAGSLAELMQASGSWQLGFDLAPAGKHGQYQGFFGSGCTVARMLGPLLVTTLIISWGTAGWLLLGGLFLLAGLATVPAVRAARTRMPRTRLGNGNTAGSHCATPRLR